MFGIKNSLEEKQQKELLAGKLITKMDEIPLMQDILEQLCTIEIDESKTAKVVISVQNFEKCENIVFEKILKQG